MLPLVRSVTAGSLNPHRHQQPPAPLPPYLTAGRGRVSADSAVSLLMQIPKGLSYDTDLYYVDG